MTHYEETLQRDIERIRAKVRQMAALAERSLKSCMKALTESNRQLAYSVIVRDQRIDELEKEIDRLCLEFIVRQQPVAGTLRFAYAAIKINSELERVGDYAESMARQILMLSDHGAQVPPGALRGHRRPGHPDAARLGRGLRQPGRRRWPRRRWRPRRTSIGCATSCRPSWCSLQQKGQLPLEALSPLMTIVNRFERVGDQAKAICQEVLYMCTGEYLKHHGSDVFRLLFVDEHNSCRSQMAEAIGNSLGQPKFVFSSAGLERRPIDPTTLSFLRDKGLDIARHTLEGDRPDPAPGPLPDHRGPGRGGPAGVPAAAHQGGVPGLERAAIPRRSSGTPAEIRAAYEETYEFLHAHIQDLVEAVLGDTVD